MTNLAPDPKTRRESSKGSSFAAQDYRRKLHSIKSSTSWAYTLKKYWFVMPIIKSMPQYFYNEIEKTLHDQARPLYSSVIAD